MLNHLNLHYRLATLFMLAGLLPVLVASLFVIEQMNQTVTTNALYDLEGRRDSKQLSIERWFDTRIANIDMLAESQIAINTVQRLSDSDELLIKDKNQNYFNSFLRLYDFNELLVTDTNGSILYSTKVTETVGTHVSQISANLARSYEQALFSGSFITDLARQEASDAASLYISSLIRDQASNVPIGVVIARLPREILTSIMREEAGMGVTGDAFLVGSDNFLRSDLPDSENQKRGVSDVLNTNIRSQSIKRAFAGIKDVTEELDYRGRHVLSSYTQLNIPHLNWALVLKIDVDEVLQPVTSIQQTVMLLLATIAVIIFIFAWFSAKAVSDPINVLTTQANAIARGELGQTIAIAGKDEIATLSHALTNILDTQQAIADVAKRMSHGQAVKAMNQRSQDDSLVLSLNSLITVFEEITSQANSVAAGDYQQKITVRSTNDELAPALNKMIVALASNETLTSEQQWLQEAIAEINHIVLGEQNMQRLTQRTLNAVAAQLNAVVGTFYVNQSDDDIDLMLHSSFAFEQRKHSINRFARGEGLVGQAALEGKPIFVSGVPDDYVRIVSGVGEASPTNISVFPLLYKQQIMAVIEIATLKPLSEIQQGYLAQLSVPMVTAFEVINSRATLEQQQTVLANNNDELVEQAQALREVEHELLAQQEKLQSSNEQLEKQARELEHSQSELEAQQAQVELMNSDLQDKNTILETQALEMEQARKAVALKAEDLSVANRYKSEFLANMSHELRTPLNSLLLLARSFQLNEQGNLSGEQVEEAKIIYDSGSDLLNLINEILDLAKIEAGRIELRPESIKVAALTDTIHDQFRHMAQSQGLAFEVVNQTSLDSILVTDPLRMGQIIKNLVGNALKFTEQGGIKVTLEQIDDPSAIDVTLHADKLFKIQVQDTGIGIAAEKQSLVFEAFKQIDSGDQRRYGGTGLGLSITRELVNLLGGEITLSSTLSEGSVFTVYLPLTLEASTTLVASDMDKKSNHRVLETKTTDNLKSATQVLDDREFIDDDDDVILLIEDDPVFVKVLSDEITKRGYKSLIATTGELGLQLAMQYLPTGIVLDLHLPELDGWGVLSALKRNIDTRHIPVHIVTADEMTSNGFKVGAVGHTTKPLKHDDITTVINSIEHASGRDKKYVLLVEDDENIRAVTAKAIGNDVVTIIEAENGEKALSVIRDGGLDLIVLDLGLPDIQGTEVLVKAAEQGLTLPPVIINTMRDLTTAEEHLLREYSDTIIIKDVRSHERLIDEVALFLHRVVKQLPAEKKRIIQHLHQASEPLAGKNVLVVEDDMRTLFVMTKILVESGMNPIKAENGQQALDILAAETAIDIVLMDMMMPVMDGYTTMQNIRNNPTMKDLPIIALTAKAMKEDRAKCIDAGASDYMTKPIVQDKLLSLMRVWLSR